MDHKVFAPIILHKDQEKRGNISSWGAPLAVSPVDGVVWVANPDSGSISLVDSVAWTKIAEIPVGREPWSLVFSPDGASVYAIDRSTGLLITLDAHQRTVRTSAFVGSEPGAVAVNANGTVVYVTVIATHEVVFVEAQHLAIFKRISVDPYPYGIAVTKQTGTLADRIYVTHFQAIARVGVEGVSDAGREGRITIIGSETGEVERQIVLPPDTHGFPNLLAGVALCGDRAWVPHTRAAPALPNQLTTTVFAAVSSIDLGSDEEEPSARLLLNDEEVFGSPVNNPLAAIPAPDGATLYIVLGGSDLVEIVDVRVPERPRLVKFLAVGNNPRGMAVSADGRWGYVMNYLSRSVTILDLARQERAADIAVTSETLDPAVLRGKILFNNASDPRLSQKSWVSCASCHADGGTDGVTWMFPDGPRQTPPLWNAGQTRPWHWSAALDEGQDVEDTIQRIQQGIGLAPGSDPPLLGAPNAERSAELDALTAYLFRGIRPPQVSLAVGDLERGRALFVERGCVLCHGGPNWTISQLPAVPGQLDPDHNGMVDSVLRDVGSATPADLRGATGFDVPSLLALSQTAPYLHDGSQASLAAVLDSGHPLPRGLPPAPLAAQDRAALIAFLESIGPETVPFVTP